jgi:hypothetical protein
MSRFITEKHYIARAHALHDISRAILSPSSFRISLKSETVALSPDDASAPKIDFKPNIILTI